MKLKGDKYLRCLESAIIVEAKDICLNYNIRVHNLRYEDLNNLKKKYQYNERVTQIHFGFCDVSPAEKRILDTWKIIMNNRSRFIIDDEMLRVLKKGKREVQ